MYKLGDLARLVEGDVIGDADLPIAGVGGVDDVKPGDITMVASVKVAARAEESPAAAVIVPPGLPPLRKPMLKVANPRLAFARVLEVFNPPAPAPAGIHPSAVVSPDLSSGPGCSIGPLVVVGERVKLGAGVVIHPGVVIGRDVEIGDGTVIHANVVIREGTRIGRRVIVHGGTVIGSDGFGFVFANGHWVKVPQVGRVVIEDDVEIGANVTIDRATTGVTLIKRGTKTDNLVQIAHNVVVGEDCALVALSGIAGSTTLGDRVNLGGQSGLVGHITIGSDSVIAARALVINNLPPNSYVSGAPARPHGEDMRVAAAIGKVPELLRTVRELQKRLAELEGRMLT
ncbi:MAG: UDP-3-O-(3-hydroxymyristoyl)glucosamine N-acyltransferase [Patescibacteria group bacterium]